MGYSNVLKRVKRLQELGLVKRVQKEFKRKAIKYKITSRGLFQSLLEHGFAPSTLEPYKDNIILNTILYQYFETTTIRKFVTVPRNAALRDYIRTCCEKILKKLDDFRPSSYKKEEYLTLEIDDLIRNEIKNFVFQIISMSRIRSTFILDYHEPEYQNLRVIGADVNEDDENYTGLFPKPALRKDRKFLKLLEEIKKDFDKGYKDFVS
jgi:DNA-binding Lrp family transcriptional regulator